MMIFNEIKDRMIFRGFLSKFNWIKLVKAKNGFFSSSTETDLRSKANVIRRMVWENKIWQPYEREREKIDNDDDGKTLIFAKKNNQQKRSNGINDRKTMAKKWMK